MFSIDNFVWFRNDTNGFLSAVVFTFGLASEAQRSRFEFVWIAVSVRNSYFLTAEQIKLHCMDIRLLVYLFLD